MKLLETRQVTGVWYTYLFGLIKFPVYVTLSDGDWSIYICQTKVWLL
jgi:hypothetical protein